MMDPDSWWSQHTNIFLTYLSHAVTTWQSKFLQVFIVVTIQKATSVLALLVDNSIKANRGRRQAGDHSPFTQQCHSADLFLSWAPFRRSYPRAVGQDPFFRQALAIFHFYTYFNRPLQLLEGSPLASWEANKCWCQFDSKRWVWERLGGLRRTINHSFTSKCQI